jgi:hypothetical protein
MISNIPILWYLLLFRCFFIGIGLVHVIMCCKRSTHWPHWPCREWPAWAASSVDGPFFFYRCRFTKCSRINIYLLQIHVCSILYYKYNSQQSNLLDQIIPKWEHLMKMKNHVALRELLCRRSSSSILSSALFYSIQRKDSSSRKFLSSSFCCLLLSPTLSSSTAAAGHLLISISIWITLNEIWIFRAEKMLVKSENDKVGLAILCKKWNWPDVTHNSFDGSDGHREEQNSVWF